MNLLVYIAKFDRESTGKSNWQVWVYDSREASGIRLFEEKHHTKYRAHELVSLLNQEIRGFIDLNNGDVAIATKSANPVIIRLTFWNRIKNSILCLIGKTN